MTLNLKEIEARYDRTLNGFNSNPEAYYVSSKDVPGLLRALREARTALQPFGSLADRFNESLPDDDSVAHIPHVALAFVNVTRGDFRRARTALAGVRDD